MSDNVTPSQEETYSLPISEGQEPLCANGFRDRWPGQVPEGSRELVEAGNLSQTFLLVAGGSPVPSS